MGRRTGLHPPPDSAIELFDRLPRDLAQPQQQRGIGRGPGSGSAKIYIDGVYTATISLYRSSSVSRSLVFAKSWDGNGTHTIKIVVLGTAGHPRVDIDAFVRLRLV
jgi:hypothetical protein